MTGQTLGRYRVLEIVGAGGMGTVYRAHDPTLVRDVALKMLHPNALEDDAARQRFVSEAQTLSHLNHPNICTVYDQLEKNAGHAYICPYEIATAYVSLRNNDKAYEWLRRGVEERADCMAWLGVEPWMEPFRSDPRYLQLLREVGLHADSR